MSSNKTRGRGRGGSVVVAAGSVWESRMKSDEVRGGIKVFNNAEEEERSSIGVAASGAKRKTWKNSGEKQCDGRIKKSPIQTRKVERTNMTQTRKLRSGKGAAEIVKEGGESGEGQLRKSKSESDSVKKNDSDSGSGFGSGSADDLIQLRKTKSDSDSVSDESKNVIDGSDSTGCEKEVEDENMKNNDFVDNCKDFEVLQEKIILSSSDNASVNVVDENDEADEGGEEGEEKEEMDDEEVKIDMENVSLDVEEISIPESNSKIAKEPENIEMENESCDVKEISIPESDSKIAKEPENKKIVMSEPENKKVVIDELLKKKKKDLNESEPKKIVSAHTRFHHRNEKPVSVPIAVKQSAPIRRHSTIYQNFTKANTIPKAEEYRSFPQTQNKMQSIVDLIMWRDVSRSAFVFGFGTFVIISSSYAKDINLSVVSVMSYMGLVYLAVIFLYKSIICRGVIDVEDSNYVLGEEEAVWVLKLVLPYLNEFLSKLKALFSGDPGTTMKLAVLLFVLARCGSCITVWKMAKIGFFGVFTVPKICSSYSAQLTAYANFWIHRFRDAWDSCSHKKAVALGIFGLVWNLSSVVARIWAVFVLFAAFRYYQQHYLVREECMEDVAECDETWQEPVPDEVGIIGQKKGRVACFGDTNKVKKGF